MSSPGIQFVQRSGFMIMMIPATAEQKDFDTIPGLMGQKLGMPGTPPLAGIAVDFSQGDPNESIWKDLESRLSGISGKHRFFFLGVSKGMQKLMGKSTQLMMEHYATLDDVFAKLTGKRDNVKPTAVEKSDEDIALEKTIIGCFQKAAIHTLKVQCSTAFKAGKPYVKNEGNRVIHDIAATMGLMSKSVSGSVALGFKEDAFLKVMSKMLGEKYDSLSTDMEDGCGELLNIIFGNAKKELTDSGHQFGKTLPTIFIGPALRVRQLTPNPAFVLPFESSIGDMYLEVGYRRT